MHDVAESTENLLKNYQGVIDEMLIKIFDILIPLSGAIIFLLLYMEKLPIKKNNNYNKFFYKRYKIFFLLMMIVLSFFCMLIIIG